METVYMKRISNNDEIICLLCMHVYNIAICIIITPPKHNKQVVPKHHVFIHVSFSHHRILESTITHSWIKASLKTLQKILVHVQLCVRETLVPLLIYSTSLPFCYIWNRPSFEKLLLGWKFTWNDPGGCNFPSACMKRFIS